MTENDAVLQFWRGILDTVPEPDKLGQLTSLNQIPVSVIATARRLGNVRSATGFVSSYLRPEQRRFVEQFVRDVVLGDMPAETWKRGRTLVPDWSFAEQVTLSPDILLAPIGGRFSHRINPSLAAWEAGVSWVGAPCLAQPDADYLSPIPDHAAGLGKEAHIELAGDLSIAIRRWIAARIAAVVRSRVGTDFGDAQVSAVASSFVPISQWTVEARAALQGLMRESRERGSHAAGPPGFRGADDWFRLDGKMH